MVRPSPCPRASRSCAPPSQIHHRPLKAQPSCQCACRRRHRRSSARYRLASGPCRLRHLASGPCRLRRPCRPYPYPCFVAEVAAPAQAQAHAACVGAACHRTWAHEHHGTSYPVYRAACLRTGTRQPHCCRSGTCARAETVTTGPGKDVGVSHRRKPQDGGACWWRAHTPRDTCGPRAHIPRSCFAGRRILEVHAARRMRVTAVVWQRSLMPLALATPFGVLVRHALEPILRVRERVSGQCGSPSHRCTTACHAHLHVRSCIRSATCVNTHTCVRALACSRTYAQAHNRDTRVVVRPRVWCWITPARIIIRGASR